MPEKKMVSAKIAGRTATRLDEYADREEISRSQAIDRLIKQGLDVEESDMRLVPVQTDGGTKLENQLDQVEDQLQDQSKQITEQRKYQQLLNLTLGVSALWLVVYFALGLSPLWTGVTGLPLVGVLSYMLYRDIGDESE
jgi:Flp pilus assembly protein TadB